MADDITQGESTEFIVKAINNLKDKLGKLDSVEIKNLDEVKAHLKNELRPLLKLTEQKTKEESKQFGEMSKDMDVIFVKKNERETRVNNFDEIKFPKDVKVNNLKDLQAYFQTLGKQIDALKGSLNIELPAPQVTVNPPEVNIPDIKLPDRDIDFSQVLKALSPLKHISNQPNKPISVRIASKDGKRFLEAIEQIKDNGNKQIAAVSQGLNESSARKAFKSALNSTVSAQLAGEGRKTLSSAGTGVQLSASSVPCSYVDITADSTRVAVGSSASVQITSPTGVIVTPNQTPYRIYTDNLNKIYVSAGSGAACYAYYV